jgi:hypothetical protein
MSAPAVNLWWRESSNSVRYLCVHPAPLHEALGVQGHGLRAGEHWTWDRARRFLSGLDSPEAKALLEDLDHQAAALKPKKPPKRVQEEPPKRPAWTPHDALSPEFRHPPMPFWHKGELWISARDLWRHIKPTYQFMNWMIYRNRQHMRGITNGGTLLSHRIKRESTGGRPAADYLLTPDQALALVKLEGQEGAETLCAWFGGLAVLRGILESGAADLGPAVAELAGALVIRDAYSAKELEALLSGRPGLPKLERRWRERIAGRKWSQVESADSRAALYRADAETLAAVRIVVAESFINAVLGSR